MISIIAFAPGVGDRLVFVTLLFDGVSFDGVPFGVPLGVPLDGVVLLYVNVTVFDVSGVGDLPLL